VRVKAEEIPAGVVSSLVEQLTGMRLERSPGGVYAVAAVRQGSGAERIGVQAGDLLLAINGRALSDPASLRRSVVSLQGQTRALIMVQRGNGRYHVAIPLG
jgi:S1-C subfamily serine protease